MAMGVELVWSSIRRAARELGSVHLLLRAVGDRAVAERVLFEVAADTLVPGEQDSIVGGGYVLRQGPVVVVDDGLVTRAEADQWYRDLAAGLERAGVSGRLSVVSRSGLPEWGRGVERVDPLPRAHLLYRREVGESWRLPAASVAALGAAVDGFVKGRGGRGLVGSPGPQFQVDPGRDVSGVVSSLVDVGWCQLLVLDEASRWTTALHLERQAHVSVMPPVGVGLGEVWREVVAGVRGPLLWHPELLEVGFVRTIAGAWYVGSTDYPLAYVNRTQPYVRQDHYTQITDRLEHLGVVLPDAHGLQVVSGAHLEKAEDLSDWVVSRVGEDRFLVEARDLGSWFAQPVPDAEVLAKARADFGRMLITAETIGLYPATPPRTFG